MDPGDFHTLIEGSVHQLRGWSDSEIVPADTNFDHVNIDQQVSDSNQTFTDTWLGDQDRHASSKVQPTTDAERVDVPGMLANDHDGLSQCEAHSSGPKLSYEKRMPEHQFKYKCPMCDKSFMHLNGRVRHMLGHKERYFCTFDKCYYQFKTQEEWKKHEHRLHVQEEAFLCMQSNRLIPCFICFDKMPEFQAHLSSERYITENASILKTEVSAARIHRHSSESYWCGFCGQIRKYNSQRTSEMVEKIYSYNAERIRERFSHIAEHIDKSRLGPAQWLELRGRGRTKVEMRDFKPGQVSDMYEFVMKDFLADEGIASFAGLQFDEDQLLGSTPQISHGNTSTSMLNLIPGHEASAPDSAARYSFDIGASPPSPIEMISSPLKNLAIDSWDFDSEVDLSGDAPGSADISVESDIRGAATQEMITTEADESNAQSTTGPNEEISLRSYLKCERCRRDRKKCTSLAGEERCERCVNLDTPCGPRTHATSEYTIDPRALSVDAQNGPFISSSATTIYQIDRDPESQSLSCSFNNSGYASGKSRGEAPKYDDCEEHLDSCTVYSSESIGTVQRESFVQLFADRLFKDLQIAKTSEPPAFNNLDAVLADFAARLGHGDCSQDMRMALWFVYKYKKEISTAFRRETQQLPRDEGEHIDEFQASEN